MWSWNMWIPYTLVCEEEDIEKIIEEAQKVWIPAWRIWSVVERQDEKIVWRVKWVWVGNTEILI